MAIQTGSLRAAEHDWWATRSTAPSNAPLSQHIRNYASSSDFGISQSLPLNQIIREFLYLTISSNGGGSPSANLSIGELWKRLASVTIPGYVVGNKSVEQVQYEFYSRNTNVV